MSQATHMDSQEARIQYMRNPQTGRNIKIDGAAHRRLVKHGLLPRTKDIDRDVVLEPRLMDEAATEARIAALQARMLPNEAAIRGRGVNRNYIVRRVYKKPIKSRQPRQGVKRPRSDSSHPSDDGDAGSVSGFSWSSHPSDDAAEYSYYSD